MNNFIKCLLSVIICELVGIAGSFLTSSTVSSNWYLELQKPFWQPSGWVFAPVWTALYILMGVALFLVCREAPKNEPRKVRLAVTLFFIQLILNFFWSIIFFNQRSLGGAFIEIIFLWIAIILTIIAFYKISRAAAWIMVPYILWVSFAAFLNFTIYSIN